MKLWFVSMECANIAEAGGVKNVTFSLCKEFSLLGHEVTLFIPVFKCNSWDFLKEVKQNFAQADIFLCGKNEKVTYTKAICNQGDFNVVLINHPSLAEKEAVYTYTDHEQKLNPDHKKGEGHQDSLFLDVLFQKSVCQYLNLLPEKNLPQIIHCQDASAAILPAFLAQTKFSNQIKSLVTIHNAGPFYHHDFSSLGEAAWYTDLPVDLLTKAQNPQNNNHVEPFLIASYSGAALTTVSEVYADELKDPANSDLTEGLSTIFYEKNIQIKGITNGFDYERYDPENKKSSKLPFTFSPANGDLQGKFKCRKFFIQKVVNSDDFDTSGIKKYGKISSDEGIFIAYHGRVTSQKGISVLTQAIPAILSNFPTVKFVLAGQGERKLEDEIINLTEKYPGKITFMNGYNQAVVRMVTAICDFIVLPSFFEPCGLEDFIAQTYGTLPIAHRTGGLNKILDQKTGFLYDENTSQALVAKISQVITIKMLKPAKINQMVKFAGKYIRKKYLWKTVIEKKYLQFFKEILKKR